MEYWPELVQENAGPILVLNLDCRKEANEELCKGDLKVKRYPTVKYFSYGN
jgi:hypothetical protein